MDEERREWIRFPREVSSVTLWTSPKRRRQALVHDESFGGISILVDSAEDLDADDEVAIEYKGVHMAAVVRDLVLTDDGRWRLGLEWTPPDS